jgi:hypothetical protein
MVKALAASCLRRTVMGGAIEGAMVLAGCAAWTCRDNANLSRDLVTSPGCGPSTRSINATVMPNGQVCQQTDCQIIGDCDLEMW